MFNKNNFCHIASNNRNEQKAGIFVYKTTDTLDTVKASGYFNEKIIDINLHDLIIHEWHDPIDRAKVEYNLLCVVERTLENVGTAVIKSKWEADIEEIIEHLSDTYVLKTGDTMTGPLNIIDENGTMGALLSLRNGINEARTWYLSTANDGPQLKFTYITSGNIERGYEMLANGFIPLTANFSALGNNNHHWTKAYVNALNNGYDIAVPVTAQPETMALKSEVDLAANSGRMITDEGVWYAKMDAAGTIPATAEVEGRNYADFTQVDGNNDPIIVVYTYTSGAWVQTETITPPAAYDGYVPVTSKIWDIPEQTGQQGGRILWNHQSKEFTPYPMIVSFQDINVTGDSTVAMPVNPGNTQIVNKNYVDNTVAAVAGFDLFDYKWRDATTSNPAWILSDNDWHTNVNAYNHLVADIAGKTPQSESVVGTTIQFYLADDGHKIIMPDQATAASTIFLNSGAAWYYILDTDNQRFKLPRVSESRMYLMTTAPVVGNGITVGWTDGTQTFGTTLALPAANTTIANTATSNYGDNVGATVSQANLGTNTALGITTDPLYSGMEANLWRATGVFAGKKYLYFYVGQ